MKENEFIKIKLAPYALPKLLYSLYNNGVNEVTITQEDGDLVMTILIRVLEDLVYPRKVKSFCVEEATKRPAIKSSIASEV